MKNKIKSYIIILLSIFSLNSTLKAEIVFFNSENIQIEDEGNIIIAKNGKAKIPEQNMLIEGDRSLYNKKKSELIIIGNVKFFDELNNIYIESEKASYDENENIIVTNGTTYLKIDNEYEVYSKDIFYDRNSMKVFSKLHTTILDTEKNIYYLEDGFLLDSVKEILTSKSTNIWDNEKNNYLFEMAKINLQTKELVGKEITIDFKNSFFGDEKNEPLLRGKSTISNNDKTTVQKTVFSTCNTEDKKCRGWELQSDQFIHNKIEKIFEYKNSWLKVFDQRVFFLPYFSHPDPSVKRKSGFLTPIYSSSDNLGKALNIPYFYAISNSRDMTFNPRIYSKNPKENGSIENFILQSEYKQAFENSNLIADFSYNKDKNKKTNTHAIINLSGDIGDVEDNTTYTLELQNVTNDNYLKIHDFSGVVETNPLVSSINPSSLNSFFSINKEFDDNTELSSSIRMYEDLTVSNNNDRYQYIFPDFSFYKNIGLNENYHGNFIFNSNGYQKNYNTNIYEAQVNNTFSFESFDFFSKNGFKSNYNLLLKNFNTYSENSSTFNKNNDHELFSTLSLNTEFPLKKEMKNTTNYLKPKIQLKFSPTNGKDISSEAIRLSYDNLFSSNRIGRDDMVEEGKSFTIGLEFEKLNTKNQKLLGFNIGNIIKDKKNSSMPSKAKLNQTRSDIVGNVFYEPSSLFRIDYNFSLDRDLDFSNYDAIGTRIGANKFVTSFNYITENHELGNSETITNDTKLEFTNEHSLKFNTAKDLKTDFTQYYNLSYEYETDCLFLSFQYQKKFFRKEDLVPDESLNFLIKFIPFTEIRGTANTVFEYK